MRNKPHSRLSQHHSFQEQDEDVHPQVYDLSDDPAPEDRRRPSESSDTSSFDNIEVEKQRTSWQRRALFRKNLSFMMRQKCTNICQLLTPILGLCVVLLIRKAAEDNLSKFISTPLNMPVPLIFGLPYSAFSSLSPALEINDCLQWYAYEFDPSVSQNDREFMGYNRGKPMNDPDDKGVLSNVQSFPCVSSNYSTPYFELRDGDMDEYIFNTLTFLADQPIDLQDLGGEVPNLNLVPDGGFKMHAINSTHLKYTVLINDNRYYQYHRNNGITKIGFNNKGQQNFLITSIEGQIAAVDLLNKAYMRTRFPDMDVVSGIKMMPLKLQLDQNVIRVMNLMGAGLFPLCLCMLLPVFVYQIVLEKEAKLIDIMKMNGLRMRHYWFVTVVLDFFYFLIQCTIFILFGRFGLRLQFFIEENYFFLLLFLCGWGFSQIALAFFFSSCISKSQNATIVGYLISIWMTVVASSLNMTLFELPKKIPWYFYLYPTFPFTRVFYIASAQCGYASCISTLAGIDQESWMCVGFLYLSAVIYCIVGIYLHEVVPQEYGVPRHPCFCFLGCRSLCNKKRRSRSLRREQYEHEDGTHEHIEDVHVDIDLSNEDEDSRRERSFAHSLTFEEIRQYPLVIKDLRKVYPGYGGRPPKVANKKMCLVVRPGEMFGLLGPNGAGKTTLISMLTGLYPANNGNAWVAGYSIRSDMQQVQLKMGVCPQFDVLWQDLTVEEHLLFYARLKGIPAKQEKAAVLQSLEDVRLTRFKTFLVKQLSGGMKRRLSVAISMVGDPSIVFLDEPSTGLDPENRRQLWDILVQQRGKRAIIITTHSMEEADVLCSRIGIVTDGVLRCVGIQVRLKTLYGGGYHLFVNAHKRKYISLLKERRKSLRRNKRLPSEEIKELESKKMSYYFDDEDLINDKGTMHESDIHNNIIKFVKTLVPSAILIQGFNGNFIFQIPTEGFRASILFREMEANKKRLRISDWGISQSTLEDVFTRICVS